MMIKFIIPVFFIFTSLNSFSPWGDYQLHQAFINKDYNEVLDVLLQRQVESPDDPKLNYNLGTIFYHLRQWEDAKNSFARSVENISKENNLKEQSYFNLGNSHYKICQNMLGDGWESRELKPEELDAAINEIGIAIESYKNTLIINAENQFAIDNKVLAEELLRKLREKKQKQEQQDKKQDDNGDNKQDKQQNDKNDKKDQDQQESGQDQDDSQDKDSKDKDSQDKDSESQKKQDKNKKRDEQNDSEQDDPEQGDKKENEDTSEKQQDDEKKSDSADDKEKEQEEKDEASKEDKDQQEEDGDEKEEKSLPAGAGDTGEQEQESMEEKGLRALLDSLQNDESNLQKKMLRQKSKGTGGALGKGQKPW